MSSYLEIFNRRGKFYNNASQMCPEARATERQFLFDLMKIQATHIVCDAPAGGGYVSEGLVPLLNSSQQIICAEPSLPFIAGINQPFLRVQSRIDQLSLQDRTVDRVASLAGLHHLEDTTLFFHEAHRILAPGGMLTVGDVLEGSAPSNFLNDSVDRFTETGHVGRFFTEGEMTTLLVDAGFQNVSESYQQFCWNFPDRKTLVQYCRQLFGMVKADSMEVERELDRYFTILSTARGACLPWSLVYAVGTKAKEES